VADRFPLIQSTQAGAADQDDLAKLASAEPIREALHELEASNHAILIQGSDRFQNFAVRSGKLYCVGCCGLPVIWQPSISLKRRSISSKLVSDMTANNAM
jgi:hypothetical protein